ncbi:unnamed protein product [Closterium sp. NIES-53]
MLLPGARPGQGRGRAGAGLRQVRDRVGAGAASGASARGLVAGGAGTGATRAGGTGAGGTLQRRPFFVPPPPSSLPAPGSVLRQALCPSSVPLQVPLLSPPASSLPDGPDPEFDLVRAASPTVRRLLATVVTDPSFESTAASVFVAELVDYAATCRLNYAASHCLAVAVPHLVAMLLAPEGDPDAPNIPTSRSYAEAITGPYSSHWQTAMDAKMASWKFTGTYVLQRFGFWFSLPQSTPLPTGHSLSAPGSDESVEPSGQYPGLVSCLMYLMTCTRPDLAYPLSILARYVALGRHRLEHWEAAKRVLRYLCSTSGMGLMFGRRGPVVLTGHADASLVDDLATQRLSQGYTFGLGSGSDSWQSTHSSSVLSSSCEAEIYAGAMAAQELRWLTYLLTDLGESPRSPPLLPTEEENTLLNASSSTWRKVWKIFDVHSKETVAARDVIFYERLTLQTYLANLQEDQDPTGGFRGNRAFAFAEDEADWDEQNVDNASEEAGPLPFCSVDVPMDDDNPRESVNAETFYHFADNGYVTPATVNTNEAERVGPNFLPDPEAGDEAAYPEDANLPRYSQTGLQILGLVTAVQSNTLPKEPATVQQALGGEHREKWREAMDKELKALEDRNTWKFVPISVARNKTILTGKWVFRVKTKADGTIEKFKARRVVRGFDQEHGRDFTETFAPVSRHTSLRIILAIAAMKKKKLQQIDVANAFLYALVDAEIFVELPHSSHGEPNQYRLTKDEDYILLIVYVDDLLYIGSTDIITIWFEGEMQRDLTLTVSSTVTQYLGLNIREKENAIYLSAEKYADTIAKCFTITPAAIFTPYRYTAGNDKGGSALLKPAGIRDYQKKLGCLLFAAVTCRPDLSYSASQLATYLKRPEAEHLAELDRALHYFVSTLTVGLTYHKNATAPPKLIGYVVADHAGDSDNRRSRTGYIYRFEPIEPISWQSSKQELIALSSAEAEYIALCSATKEGLYLRELLVEAKLAELPNFTLFCDNQSAIRIANKNGFANRTKHIALRYFFVKDEIEKGRLVLSYCPTSEMAADSLTKKLGKQKFEYCMLLAGQSHVSDTPEAKGSV